MNEEYRFECPRYMTALLKDLDSEIARQYWNETQKEWESPLANTGNEFINDTFELKAYDWDDEEDYNFRYKDYRIAWYKHIGRNCVSNKKITPEIAVEIYKECFQSLQKAEEKRLKNER